ncbi:MAG TPA: hypothetical protein VJH06_00700 [Candidatus Paceibacterota bacterium]
MQPETKNCQKCKKDFTIEPDDFGFYEKIKVPPPTFCPDCRFKRRLASSNERSLFKRKCDLSGNDIFSMYPADAPFPVYNTDDWYSDKWDPYEYGMDYDFSRPFFEQFQELLNKVPKMALVRQGLSINSPYVHRVTDPKNSYMVFRATGPIDSLYSYTVEKLKDSSDIGWSINMELSYECLNCENCYNIRFSQESVNCRDSSFLYACRNCSDCVGCVNLTNKQFCIWNEQYTKEAYFEKLKELGLNTFSGIEKAKLEFETFRKKFPQKAVNSIKSEDVSGNWFSNCKNVHQSFDCINIRDGKYLYSVFNAQDCRDYWEWGNNSELMYESENCGINDSRIFFCTQCWTGAHDLFYCDSCPGAGFCFGCVGLKKGEYSILNKKYSKEEYETMVEKIKQQMMQIPYTDNMGREYRFGEHFPDELSTFPYNETAAYDLYPLTKEEAIAQGYKWRDREKRNYETTIKSADLPETIGEVSDEILKEVIECGEKDSPFSVGAFRITSNELAFYRKMNLPLPRVCFDVRHMRRLAKRPPLKLIKRNCDKCSVEVETVYTKEHSPIIYCEACYKQEVY